MIPTIEDILKGYKQGIYSMRECLGWLDQHMKLAAPAAGQSGNAATKINEPSQ